MNHSSLTTKSDYFDLIAHQWDTWQDSPRLKRFLYSGIIEFDVKEGESILDVGCGTGNLTAALLENLSSEGRIVAIDISNKMIDLAQSKINDSRVKWYVTNISNVPAKDSTFDRVFCFSVWPHIENISLALKEIHRVLKPDGILHIWHNQSRSTVNTIHRSIPLLHDDILIPAQQVADLLDVSHFSTKVIIDTDEQYLVSAKKID